MVKWKQRRIAQEQQRHDFAVAAQAVFLKLYVDKTYNLKMDTKQAKEAREAMCEAAWHVADFMMEARNVAQ